MPRVTLAGRTIAITGASSGIGAATALACAREGMHVAIAARRLDRLESLADDIQSLGVKALPFQLDVADKDASRDFIHTAASELGSFYAAFANAGYGQEAAILDQSDDDIRRMFEVNFFGSLNTLRPALDLLKQADIPDNEEHRGHIILCSSCVARMSIPYYSVYSATKAAQAHIASAMRFELEPHHIAVSSLHPIGTRTEFFDQVERQSATSSLIAHTPDRLLQSPADVAKRVVNRLKRPKRNGSEIWTGPKGDFVRFGMSVTTFAPSLGAATLRNMVKRRIAQSNADSP